MLDSGAYDPGARFSAPVHLSQETMQGKRFQQRATEVTPELTRAFSSLVS